MLYQRKRNLIYQKEIKTAHNFRINRSNFSKANDSTRDEEIKIIKNSHPIKISKNNKFENKIIYENKKEAQLIEEKKLIKVNWEISKKNENINSNYNERRINSPKLDSDINNIISLKVKKNRNINKNNDSYFRNDNIFNNNFNNYNNQNYKNKDFNSKEDYKVNDYESFRNNANNIYNNYNNSNYIRYKSGQKKFTKQIIKNNNNYNYNISNKITPKKNISYEIRKKNMENSSTVKSELNSIKTGSEITKDNYSNKSFVKYKRKIDMNSVSEFPLNEMQKNKNPKKYDNLTFNDIKKITKKYNKIFEIDESDIIIKDTKIISPGESYLINNNYNKINRLSNILLPKNKKEKEQNANSNYSSDKKIIESKSKVYSSKMIIKEIKIKHSFYYLSLIFSKNNIPKKHKHFKNIPKKLKNKEKSAIIIQKWWKNYRLIFIKKLNQIIYIQSFWRGFYIRKNIVNRLYSNYLYITFCQKIKNVLTNKIRRDAFKRIKNNNNIIINQMKIKNKYNKIIYLIENIFKIKRFNIINIFWDKFIYIFNKKERKKNKGKNLIQIKKNQEQKLKILYSGFITWAYKAKIKRFQNKDLEYNNKSIYVKNNKTKYQSYRNRGIIFSENNTKTKIIKYLIKQKSNNSKDLLRKFFYKWYINSLNKKYKISINQYDKKMLIIKIKLYILILETFFIKQNKKNLRIFFQKIKHNNNKENGEFKNNFLNNIKHINEGYKLLQNFIFRNTYKNPLYCIMDKINNENIDINLMKILMNKKRNEKELLKDIFLIWKNKVIIEKKNDIIKALFIKIINIYQKCYKHNLLIKKLYQWKNISNIIKITDKSLIKGRILFNIKDFIINKNVKINFKLFLSKIKTIKKAVNHNDLQKLKKIILYNNRKNNIDIIRKYYNKWIHYFIKYEILILKGKIILNLFYKYHINNDKILLFKYFNYWKNNIFEYKINQNNYIINNIFKSQEINFRESRIKIRNILLKSIIRKINNNYIYHKLKEYLKKWKIIKYNETINYNKKLKLENIFSKILLEDVIKERILKKRLLLWKNKANNLGNQKTALKNIFERNNQKLYLNLNYYLNRWLFIANSIKLKKMEI